MHAADEEAAASELYLPAAQLVHAGTVVTSALYVPALQAVHAADVAAAATVP